MGKLKKINSIRRNIMQSLTKNVGNSIAIPCDMDTTDIRIKRVLINRPNGRLGNLLLITPLIQEVTEVFPDCKIDVFVKGNLAPILFKNYSNVNQIIPLPGKPFKQLIKYISTWVKLKKNKYDLVINVIPTSSSGRLSTKIARSPYKIFGELPETFQDNYCDCEHIAKHPVYSFREYLDTIGLSYNKNSIKPLDLKLQENEIEEGKQLLKSLVKNDKKTICLFTYATGEKCHSKTWWREMYVTLQTHFPDFNIIEVLPKENVSQIDFKATTFYSCDLREIGALINSTTVFIGADSGMMHLASAVHTPTVGLFSVTNQKMYEPYNKKSIAKNTNTCNIEDCIKAVKAILDTN